MKIAQRMMILGTVLGLLMAADVALLSAAGDWSYAGSGQLYQNGDLRILMLPLAVPQGAEVRIPPATEILKAGLDPWVSFLVTERGGAEQLARNQTPTIRHIDWPAPLRAEKAVFTRPAPPTGSDTRLEAVWRIDLADLPPEKRLLAETLFVDRAEPPRILGEDAVKHRPGWFVPADMVIRSAASITFVGILLTGATLLRLRPTGDLSQDPLESLASVAQRARQYVLQLRNLVAMCVGLVVLVGVCGFVAFVYFLDSVRDWAPARPWSDWAVLGILFAGLALLSGSTAILVQAQRELRRLRAVKPPL